ncbi:MAG: Hsp20/alpha crystallin family protein [Candidatus Marsarchaeota archaeon]|jgi:HSP20 family protein|nr:Hsp20/alpha crystallin family protein [Candidatus Marsarchaeota archaeon]
MAKDSRKKAEGINLDDLSSLNAFMAKFIREINQSLNNMGSGREPLIYGVNMRIGEGGEPIIEKFGTIQGPQQQGQQPSAEREPLIDIIERDNELTVIAEVPGINRDEIKIEADQSTMSVDAKSTIRSYHKVIRLPKLVDPNSASAKYNNGVLEVGFKIAATGGKPRSIPIS